jgi:hypothetical protein
LTAASLGPKSAADPRGEWAQECARLLGGLENTGLIGLREAFAKTPSAVFKNPTLAANNLRLRALAFGERRSAERSLGWGLALCEDALVGRSDAIFALALACFEPAEMPVEAPELNAGVAHWGLPSLALDWLALRAGVLGEKNAIRRIKVAVKRAEACSGPPGDGIEALAAASLAQDDAAGACQRALAWAIAERGEQALPRSRVFRALARMERQGDPGAPDLALLALGRSQAGSADAEACLQAVRIGGLGVASAMWAKMPQKGPDLPWLNALRRSFWASANQLASALGKAEARQGGSPALPEPLRKAAAFAIANDFSPRWMGFAEREEWLAGPCAKWPGFAEAMEAAELGADLALERPKKPEKAQPARPPGRL